MAEHVNIEEFSGTYASAMRNVLPAGPGVCRTCKTFVAPEFTTCYSCFQQLSLLDEVVPITYSEHLDQMHTALRNYKDGFTASVRSYALNRIAAILWRFLAAHETCVASAVGVAGFDLVTTVPSSTPEKDDRRGSFRAIAAWCTPIASRYERVLRATGRVPSGRHVDLDRYTTTRRVEGANVLLLDDTWVSGGHAQSAAGALGRAGASKIAAVVVGRHVQPNWDVAGRKTSEIFAELPRVFDWERCAVH